MILVLVVTHAIVLSVGFFVGLWVGDDMRPSPWAGK